MMAAILVGGKGGVTRGVQIAFVGVQ